jgi:hypothetical protein
MEENTMRLDKVILRAALNTLAAIGILIAFMIFALCFILPSTMMRITYDLGMDGSSIRNAKRAYRYSGSVDYIAYATEVAIGADDDEYISECGKMFIADDEFTVYCQKRNAALPEGVEGVYEQYVYGQVSVAEYRLGNKDSAVDIAFDGVQNSFPKNNAVVALLLTAFKGNDRTTVLKIYMEMDAIDETISTEEKAYFNEIFALCQQSNG